MTGFFVLDFACAQQNTLESSVTRTSDAMDRCLQAPAILSNIAAHLLRDDARKRRSSDPWPNTPKPINATPRPALLAFIRTCKPLYKAGLPWLWATQDTLDHLLACLPARCLSKDRFGFAVRLL